MLLKLAKEIRVVRNLYIYFVTYALNALLSFVTISLLTHHLSTVDYGIINLYSSLIILLTPFITGGILYPLSVEFYKRPREEYRRFFTNALVIPFLSLIAFTLICGIFSKPFSEFIHVSPVWLIILPLTVWWNMYNEITIMLCRNRNQPVRFALFSTGKNLTEILLTIGLVIGLNWAWQGRLFSAAAASLLLGLASIYIFRRWGYLIKTIDWKEVRRIAWISFPFIFERLSVFVLSNSDRYFIEKLDAGSTHEVGLYSVGAQIALMVFLVIISINSAYHPYLFENLSAGNKSKVRKATAWYIGASGLMVLILFAAIPFLFRYFIGDDFSEARQYSYYLSGGYFMLGVYSAFLGYLIYYGKNRLIFFISLIGMVFSIASNYVMVSAYGAIGAAYTSILTYSLMAGITFLFARRFIK